jgi:hypothetical protein
VLTTRNLGRGSEKGRLRKGADHTAVGDGSTEKSQLLASELLRHQNP